MACSVLALWATLLVGSASACQFDFSTSSWCGPRPSLSLQTFTINTPFSDGTATSRNESLQTLDLSGRGITSIAAAGFEGLINTSSRFNEALLSAVVLDDNNITEFPNMAVFVAVDLVILRRNNITSLASRGFESSVYRLPFKVDLSENQIHVLEPLAFSVLQYSGLSVDLTNNTIEVLPAQLFGDFFGSFLSVDLSNNKINTMGAIFAGFGGTVFVSIDVSNNHATGESVQAALSSLHVSTADVWFGASANNVTEVPAHLLSNFAANLTTTLVFPTITVDLSRNPIDSINAAAFSGGLTGAQLRAVSFNFSYPVAGSRFEIPAEFNFDGVTWSGEGWSLAIDLQGTNVNLSVVRAISSPYQHGPFSITLDLSFNNYTDIPPGTFASSNAVSVDLSHNQLTNLSPTSFEFNFVLQQLDVSFNHLTVIDNKIMDVLAGLTNFIVAHNDIVALPLGNNNIRNISHATSNPLQCDSYGPTLANCTCTSSTHPYFNVTTILQYGRCLPYPNVCPENRLFDASDKTFEPFPACISSCSQSDHYFNVDSKRCLPTTNCSTAFLMINTYDSQQYHPAYEVDGPTVSTDRMCSICSTCPSDFKPSPCTPTVNSHCTKKFTIARPVLAAILIGALIPLFLLVGLLLYLKYGKELRVTRSELGSTKTHLELTERLLGDERTENHFMEQAWSILEQDLTIGEVIGQGAYGTVYSASWGHIPVAVKVLQYSMGDLDAVMIEDIQREIKVMRGMRHPHVITFYGAGVDRNDKTFLVTELMQGSVKTLIRNSTTTLSWPDRLTFLCDIARGMKYLHDQGTVHRDLKADNCFYDESLRVKVADFGTGRIMANLVGIEGGDLPRSARLSSALSVDSVDSNTSFIEAARTLSRGVGTLMWMAPEALQGRKIPPALAPALDVYSYGIVMWEIWTCAEPWSEIAQNGIQFCSKLIELVSKGVRPQRPPGCESAPEGYHDLMEICWKTQADRRPSMSVVLSNIEYIIKAWTTTESAL
eukprot:m.366293 g.366293  ORF g.366293 m.366293 type:complete len:997 (-) comp28093_c0_seq7:285-3275(-)